MKKSNFHSVFLPLVVIPIGGLLTLGLYYFFYMLIYNFVEFHFFPNNPTSVPADILRRAYALALLVFYLVLLRTMISDIIKAIFLVGTMGIFTTTAILAFYETQALAIVTVVVIIAVSTCLLYRYRKSWFYYYAFAITVLASIALALPEM